MASARKTANKGKRRRGKAANQGARRRRRRVLAVVAAVLIGASAWMMWPFWQLSGQFGAQPSRQPSRLYGRPLELYSGAAVGSAAVRDELLGLGYRQAEGEAAMVPGTFRVVGNSLEISRRPFTTARGVVGRDRLRILFRGAEVAGVEREGRRVAFAELEPPVIASYYSADLRERRPVQLDDVPEDLLLAVLAAEDARFLEHRGVSLTGTLRALWVNLRAQRVRQGGSTLTQQLVKNLYLTHERRVVRKLREAVLAVLLELRYDKRAILQAYLNEIYWGRSGNVQLMGIGAAAWAYFGKRPAQLDLAESALLAGMIQAPGALSPRSRPEEAKKRRDVVLARLGQLRWVEQARLARASQQALPEQRPPMVTRGAPYFADAMADEARRRFALDDLADAGYSLYSTLDRRAQEAAEEALQWGVAALEKGWEKGRETATPLQAALVSVDPATGALRAYVGGRDYARSQFDRVTHARRQAGSAFKPIVYAAAFERRIAHPASWLRDEPILVQAGGRGWSPQNSDGTYRGWVRTRTALEDSLNVPTARLAMEVGLEHVVGTARQLGIGGRLDPYPALALGAMEVTPRELATVYAALAAGGVRPPLHGLLAVHDRTGRAVAGKALPAPERVLEAEVAYLVTSILQGVLERGTGRGVRAQGVRDPLAGKTGTTNSRRDSWFAGYSPDRATLVWVGYDDNAKTRLSGSRAALPIWARFVHRLRPPNGYTDFDRPAGIVAEWIDPTPREYVYRACEQVAREYFLADFGPEQRCSEYGMLLDPDPRFENLEHEKKHPFRRWLHMLRGKKKPKKVI